MRRRSLIQAAVVKPGNVDTLATMSLCMAYYARMSTSRTRNMPENCIQNLLRVTLLLLTLFHAAAVSAVEPGEESVVYEDNRFALGVGLGLVKFDTNAKVSLKETDRSYFVDLEGDLGLPDENNVNTIYGAIKFDEKHSLLFGYFAINRKNRALDYSDDLADIVVIDATVDVADRSKFYSLAYGYNLFQDDRSYITLVAGLKTIDLQLEAEARGSITVNGITRSAAEVVESDVIAPIPLIGLNFAFEFTPEWSIWTRVGLVAGSYQGISASILETRIDSHYQLSRHVGLSLGLTHFDADIDVDDDDEVTEVLYGYSGAFVGLHFTF